jgi:hypothetical protein
LNFLPKKLSLPKLSKMWVWDPEKTYSGFRIKKKAPDPGSGSATLILSLYHFDLSLNVQMEIRVNSKIPMYVKVKPLLYLLPGKTSTLAANVRSLPTRTEFNGFRKTCAELCLNISG